MCERLGRLEKFPHEAVAIMRRVRVVSQIAHQKTFDFYFSFAVDRAASAGRSDHLSANSVRDRKSCSGAIGLARVACRPPAGRSHPCRRSYRRRATEFAPRRIGASMGLTFRDLPDAVRHHHLARSRPSNPTPGSGGALAGCRERCADGSRVAARSHAGEACA